MKFSELQEGNIVYYAEIKNTEIVDGEIKMKQVREVNLHTEAKSVEIYFYDGTMIIPNINEESAIRGIETLKLSEPYNFKVYSCSYDTCVKIIDRIVSTKITQMGEEYKKMGIQMNKLCLMRKMTKYIESKKSVVLSPIYVD